MKLIGLLLGLFLCLDGNIVNGQDGKVESDAKTPGVIGESFSVMAWNIWRGGREDGKDCLLYTSPSPRDATLSRMPSSA